MHDGYHISADAFKHSVANHVRMLNASHQNTHTEIPYLGSHSDPNLQWEPIAAVSCYLNSPKSRNISKFFGISEEIKALFSLHAHH